MRTKKGTTMEGTLEVNRDKKKSSVKRDTIQSKHVYFFGGGEAEGNKGMRELLGGKGADLAEMTNLSIPVPPGFTISTAQCLKYYTNGKIISENLKKEVIAALKKVADLTDSVFGDPRHPLLVSVRSGARVSMPGMMDTVLNIGLNEETVQGLIDQSGNPRFAWDCYRRFVQMYGNVVMGVNGNQLEALLEETKKERGISKDTDLDADDLKKLTTRLKRKVSEVTGTKFPEDPFLQLWGAISAVFDSWNTSRAKTYRRLNHIPEEWGTAVNVQAMVFGNLGEDCATGVAFTRDPSTGEKRFFGEYLLNAQGEDVVAGIRTPCPITAAENHGTSLEERMPKVYKELVGVYTKLERHYREMLDIEFTIQRGKLWMLQSRTGKRTAMAAVRIAVEMVKEGLITQDKALLRLDPIQIEQLLHPTLDPSAKKIVLGKGLPASPGAASGKIVFTADDAQAAGDKGEKVILVRNETSPEDIHGMASAQGILTVTGGMTSHAAVVARGMGKPCVAGCSAIRINEESKTLDISGKTFKEGDLITLEGGLGEVIQGEVKTIQPTLDENFKTLMSWADKIRKLGVRTNADTPADAKLARSFGAEGIGLCRTEHMFFEADRIDTVREMILADKESERRAALQKILPMQKKDFLGIFREMEGLPVTIRLLDPPLHEFLPQHPDDIIALAKRLKVPAEKMIAKVSQLKEFNPMLGLRGCRLGIVYPEIYDTQVQAIMEAVCELKKEGRNVIPEIMIPLIAHKNELVWLRKRVVEIVDKVQSQYGVRVDVGIGTMIELPRAALTANEIAEAADFFSFGTNDLTQTTFGLSRDDAGRFLPQYVEQGIFPADPFVSLDASGVGKLIELAGTLGRGTKPKLKIGICGEHGGDPSSVAFCHRVGLDYVSCSPYRVPIARLAAAQAVLQQDQ